jgi:hypothetical protein
MLDTVEIQKRLLALDPIDRAVLDESRAVARALYTEGRNLNNYLALGESQLIRRREAMRLAHSNQPKGPLYSAYLADFMRADGLNPDDRKVMSDMTAVAWLFEHPERLEILNAHRATMTPGERSRLNSPISARKLVERLVRERDFGIEDKDKPATKSRKDQLAEKDKEIATLKERLARVQDGGSLFDLKRDTIETIAATIVEHLQPTRSKSIAEMIKTKLKAKVKPAG